MQMGGGGRSDRPPMQQVKRWRNRRTWSSYMHHRAGVRCPLTQIRLTPHTSQCYTYQRLTNTYNTNFNHDVDGALFMSHVTSIRYNIILFTTAKSNAVTAAVPRLPMLSVCDRDVAQTSVRDHLRKPGLTG